MAEVEVNLEQPEQTEEVKETAEEVRQEQAEQAAEDAKATAEETTVQTETAEAAAEKAETAATVATEAASQAEQAASLNESVLRQIKEIMDLMIRKVEILAEELRTTTAGVSVVMEEVRQTLELWQAEIGGLDSQIEKLGMATAALVKIETMKKEA